MKKRPKSELSVFFNFTFHFLIFVAPTGGGKEVKVKMTVKVTGLGRMHTSAPCNSRVAHSINLHQSLKSAMDASDLDADDGIFSADLEIVEEVVESDEDRNARIVKFIVSCTSGAELFNYCTTLLPNSGMKCGI